MFPRAAARALSLLTKPPSSFSISSHRLNTSISHVLEEKGAESVSDPKPSFIHPTAIVHPTAILGQAVSIGPFCTVGPSAKLGDACQLHPGSHIFGDTELGNHCVVLTGAIVGADLPGRTIIGNNNVIGHHAVVGVKCQDMKYKPGDECFLIVGDNNDIREHTSIHRSSKSSETTVIGGNNLIMGSCHIAHDCEVGNYNIFANNTLLAGHVVVEDYTHTAGGIVVHQFCHIGSFSFIGGGSVVAQDVPKYMMVAGDRAELRGLNSEGLRRHGFSSSEVQSMRRAYKNIFMPVGATMGGIEDRLAEVEKSEESANFPVVSFMVQSIRKSFEQNRRGICSKLLSKDDAKTEGMDGKVQNEQLRALSQTQLEYYDQSLSSLDPSANRNQWSSSTRKADPVVLEP